MDLLGITILLVLMGIGILAIFSPSIFTAPSAEAPPGVAKKAKKQKKSKNKSASKEIKAPASDASAPAITSHDGASDSAGGAETQNSDDEEEEQEDTNFLGLDELLPNSRGVYAVQGNVEDAALLDGWEVVDTAKYNIPKAGKGAQSVHRASATQMGQTSSSVNQSSSFAASKSRNTRRREKEQILRQGIQQKQSGGASVAQRMGTTLKRVQKEPGSRNMNSVPGM